MRKSNQLQKIKSKHHVAKAIINAAGVASMNLALTTPENVTDRLIRTNLIGTIYCCQLFAPFLIKNKTGSIVNFSTIAVPIGLRGESVYVASKAGVEDFQSPSHVRCQILIFALIASLLDQ